MKLRTVWYNLFSLNVKVAAGKGPFIGFHHALEGVEGRSVLTDVAQAVKSKFKYVTSFSI